MIVWTMLLAALALLAWRSSRDPADTVLFGAVLLLGGVMMAGALSNRLQRRLRAIAARLLCRLLDHRQIRPRLLAPLVQIRTLPELFERLPGFTAAAADVEPVTLFALDDDTSQYLPVSSTLQTLPCIPVAADEPLADAMRKSTRVHYLTGRTDDLENAPIHAVNGQQVEECQAVCALPLHRDGTLVAFLLCGGTGGSARLGLRSSASLEDLGRRYADLVGRCFGADVTIAGRLTSSPVVTQGSVSA